MIFPVPVPFSTPESLFGDKKSVRPRSHAVLHMSWTQFNQFGSWEVQLILFGVPEAFFTPGQLWITPKDQLWVKRQSSHESNQTYHQRSKGAILTLHWKTTDQQDRSCYLFGVAVQFEWINSTVDSKRRTKSGCATRLASCLFILTVWARVTDSSVWLKLLVHEKQKCQVTIWS